MPLTMRSAYSNRPSHCPNSVQPLHRCVWYEGRRVFISWHVIVWSCDHHKTSQICHAISALNTKQGGSRYSWKFKISNRVDKACFPKIIFSVWRCVLWKLATQNICWWVVVLVYIYMCVPGMGLLLSHRIIQYICSPKRELYDDDGKQRDMIWVITDYSLHLSYNLPIVKKWFCFYLHLIYPYQYQRRWELVTKCSSGIFTTALYKTLDNLAIALYSVYTCQKLARKWDTKLPHGETMSERTATKCGWHWFPVPMVWHDVNEATDTSCLQLECHSRTHIPGPNLTFIVIAGIFSLANLENQWSQYWLTKYMHILLTFNMQFCFLNLPSMIWEHYSKWPMILCVISWYLKKSVLKYSKSCTAKYHVDHTWWSVFKVIIPLLYNQWTIRFKQNHHKSKI